MTDAVDALILDLLEYVASGEKDYTDVMEAWRTSCPRLPVWEEANDRGLVTRAGRRAGDRDDHRIGKGSPATTHSITER